MVLKHGALRLTTVAAAALGLLAVAGTAQAGETRVARAAPGQSLSRLTQATPAAQVADYLQQRGSDASAAESLVEVDAGPGASGRRHVRLEQQVGGKKVWGRYAKATLGAQGELLHVIDELAPVGTALPRAARINEQQALRAALARLHPLANEALAATARSGHSTRFAKTAYFHQAPRVTRVLLPLSDGSLSEAFEVQTWSQKDNQLHHTVVNGEGLVVVIEERTANDSYNVFAIDPGKGPQTLVQGPGAGNAQSPSGWLGTGTQRNINIVGNNVAAYLDANPNNRADTGGTTVSGGNFVAAANLTQAPSTTANRAVAVQSLFYLNNRIHDILYSHGFNEAAGNFQTSNFGKGGLGNDPVNAEAQDGGGSNNANFATPADGQRPRMQMYLWSGAGPTHELAISGGATYAALGSSFGPALTTTGRSGVVTAVNDGVAAAGGGTTTDGCEALPAGSLTGRIALVDRGLCGFTVKVKNAQNAGATGVVIANNQAGLTAPGGTDSTVTIPSMMVSQADAAALRQLAAPSATMRRKAVLPVQLDGDLDSDIVYHEYGHGLTWRMIGSMSGPLAGAIGEGASDVVAFMVNGDDVVGEYAAANPLGIRRFRYAGYPLSYGNVTGAGVHADGEIYAAAMWRLRELWLASGRTNDSLFGHFVDGMNYTAATPKFENMRNGMLDAITATAGADATARCALVWQAFAQYGVGVGATGTVLSSTSVAITPSTLARADCQH